MVGHELSQHRHEDVDGVGGLARRACQAAAAHRVVGAIHLRAAVDQKNARGRGHRSEMGGKSREKNRVYHSKNVGGFLSIVAVRDAAAAPGAAAGRRRRLPARLAPAACLVRSYEYEEDIYLSLDGSAEVTVNASIAALVSLRGLRSADRSRGAPRPRSAPRRLHVTAEYGDRASAGRGVVMVGVLCRCAFTSTTSGSWRARAVLVVHATSSGRRTDRRLPETIGAVALRPGTLQNCRLERRRARRLSAAPAEPDRLSQRAGHRNERAERHRAREHPVVGAASDRSARRAAHHHRGSDGPPVDSPSHAVAVRRRLHCCGALLGILIWWTMSKAPERAGEAGLRVSGCASPRRSAARW